MQKTGGNHMTIRRDALRLGLVASAAALVGRGTARAADALTIEPNGDLMLTGALRIAGNNPLEFGAGAKHKVKEKDNQGKEIEKEVDKEVSAGKIGYQIFTTDALDIVGAGTANTNRKIKLWAEGGMTIAGPIAAPLQIAGNNALEFGIGAKHKVKEKDNQGKEIEKEVDKEASAGKIGYQTFTTDALDIVGAGTTATNRKIKLWAEGGMTIAGPIAAPLTVAGADGAKSLRVSPTTEGANMLDIQAGPNREIYKAAASGGVPAWEGKHETGLALYVTAHSDPAGKGVEFRHSNGGQGIGFGYNTIYATGTHPDQDLFLRARGTGRVQIGAQNDKQANLAVAGGVETLRMLRGIVKPDGGVVAGSGFTLKKSGTGLYDIEFTPAFPSVPGASATQIYGALYSGNAAATAGGGETTDNAVIAHLSADRMRVKTGNGNGSADDRNFSFIVIGAR
jgi:hypothetical protein